MASQTPVSRQKEASRRTSEETRDSVPVKALKLHSGKTRGPHLLLRPRDKGTEGKAGRGEEPGFGVTFLGASIQPVGEAQDTGASWA